MKNWFFTLFAGVLVGFGAGMFITVQLMARANNVSHVVIPPDHRSIGEIAAAALEGVEEVPLIEVAPGVQLNVITINGQKIGKVDILHTVEGGTTCEARVKLDEGEYLYFNHRFECPK
jgi:hypothetical protein